MKTKLTVLILTVITCLTVGCGQHVPQGYIGRIKTASGWANEILMPAKHTCFGRDKMYLAQYTQDTFIEKMEILVGGKINLTLEVQVRCGLNTDNKIRKSVFEQVSSNQNKITTQDIYDKFLKMKIQSVPREIIGSKPDVQSVVNNRSEIAAQVKKRIIDESKTTLLLVYAVEITNYDWPKSITAAQERLAQIQLEEEQEAAKIRAQLKRAEGDLKIAEKDKLVELKKAETLAESIDIIRKKLAGSPEYLKWHEIRMLSEAAKGPNNAFIIVPYGQKVNSIVNNTQLKQLLDQKTPTTAPAPATK